MLSEGLHRLERKLLAALVASGSAMAVEQLAQASGLTVDAVRRGVEWLKEKGLVEVSEQEEQLLSLGPEGEKALRKGLPERRLYELLLRGPLAVEQAARALGQDMEAAMGRALERGFIALRREAGRTLLFAAGPAPELEEEGLLKRLAGGTIALDALSEQERGAAERLLKRPGMLRRLRRKKRYVAATQKGREALELYGREEWLDALTPEALASGLWRSRPIRPIDIHESPPRALLGRKHPLTEAIEEVREAFLAMGFEEIEGSYLQPAFWNFDALFVPQDHPARELQDTFYVKGLSIEPEDPSLVQRVKQTHIDGGGTGSRGWGGAWSEEEARRALLRTHTTAVTVRFLWERRPESAQAFIVDRVFRNEKVTFKSYVEFNQVEGIAVGRSLHLRHLMGLLGEFYHRLGLKEIKFWPSYFPYTEPSLQVMAKFEKQGRALWLEMGGAGILRPEVTLPLGVRSRVLAWGLGLDRLLMLRQGIEDIRKLYEPDLRWLRERPCP
ncbi:MAG: phenylalanine--tRNA ligase subunit alpha [Nitrososphaerota archaeon]